ncbi:hypothetical protein EVAR_17566_1 [Eumeta japonica]|uniref:Uncharacterized protein n=1 Tax=Eumeta variegata TaxID=151549 RepID=A0A4C1UC58_EUMVA|nr:hypothetical protein EVAR_17566_1 [Eumeta japonica]
MVDTASQPNIKDVETMKGYPTDNALVGCYVLGKTLGRSADLKVKMKHTVLTLLLPIWLIWSELEAQPQLM